MLSINEASRKNQGQVVTWPIVGLLLNLDFLTVLFGIKS
jgi:hypothetical protein